MAGYCIPAVVNAHKIEWTTIGTKTTSSSNEPIYLFTLGKNITYNGKSNMGVNLGVPGA